MTNVKFQCDKHGLQEVDDIIIEHDHKEGCYMQYYYLKCTCVYYRNLYNGNMGTKKSKDAWDKLYSALEENHMFGERGEGQDGSL